ncbi:SDR family oxidoreductase [Streptomyces harbinensis]|uniref:SDR family oxidoreductase n=1 Tax=Streptomyces harbinensis TaxID=1176198 RepID=UPI00339B00BE
MEPSSGAIVVTGGTGTLGREVVRRLLEDEYEVRVLSRRPHPQADRTPREWAVGDLATGVGLDAALEGAATVVHCASAPAKDDTVATRHLVEAALRGSRPHLVYISIVGADRVPLGYYRHKVACERIVADSGLPWTTLRATQFHDLIARLTTVQRAAPVVCTLGGDARVQPVEVREVGDRLAELAVGEPAGRVADFGGPRVRELRELARLTARAQGWHRPVLPLRLPGKVVRAVRDGGLLAPDHAQGRGTFEEFLTRRGAMR